MTLNETQAQVLQQIANAEMRSPEQMLSLLLAEGLSFYFMDRPMMRGGAELDTDEAVRLLTNDAICQTAPAPTTWPMKPTKTQARVLQLAANAELRTPEQMLSLLLAEGVRFYFCDYQPHSGEVDPESAEFMLKQDAIRCAMGAKSNA